MIAINNLHKSFGDLEVLKGIDLNVEKGQAVVVIGPSGSGKTTFLRCLNILETPTAGTVAIDGHMADFSKSLPKKQIMEFRKQSAMVFQHYNLFPHMTARENVAYAARSEGRVTELADTLEIAGILDQRADTLSGGERQRVALARSLAADPDALLLDEPLANLDAPIKRRLRDELRPILSSLDVPVIYVTHDQREATAIGDRLAVIADGEIHQLDTPSEVFAHPATPFVASFTGSVNLFRGRVIDTEAGPALDWNGRRLDATIEEGVGTEVWFCIRPEYVGLVEVDHPNTLTGTVTRWVFEGDGHLIDVALDGGDETVRLALSPSVDDLLAGERERVRVALPPDAIHVIGGVDEHSQ